MRVIAHRGNLTGSCPDNENSPDYVQAALGEGFDAEIDCWLFEGQLMLGHDRPLYPVSLQWLEERSSRLWIHCKHLASLQYLMDDKGYLRFNCFFHQTDDFTLTSHRFIWTYPGRPVGHRSVIVLTQPTQVTYDCYGVCTDYPRLYL